MESIVVSVLGRYLNAFIKGFSREQLTLEGLKSVSLDDIELVNSSIQELLMLPTSLLVTSAKCNSLNLNLPKMTELKRKALVLSIDTIELQLEEPEEVPPMPTELREMLAGLKGDPAKRSNQGLGAQIGRNMSYSVKKLSLCIRLRDAADPIHLEISDFGLFTSNEAGERVEDVAAAKKVDEQRQEDTVFKSGSIGCVSMWVGTQDSRAYILQDLPAALLMQNVADSSSGIPLRSNLHLVLEKLSLSIDRKRFLRYYQVMRALKEAVARPIPLAEDGASSENVEAAGGSAAVRRKPREGEEVTFTALLKDWDFLLHESDEHGISIRGQDFSLTASPPRLVRQKNEESGKEERVVRSSATFKAGFFAVCDAKPGHGVGEFIVTSQVAAEPQEGVDAGGEKSNAGGGEENDGDGDGGDDESKGFIGMRMTSERVDQETPKSVVQMWMNSLQFVLKRPIWTRFVNFFDLSGDLEEVKLDLQALPSKAKAAKERLKKKMAWSFSDLYQGSAASVRLSNLSVVVPPDAELSEELSSYGLLASVKDVTLKNTPGWNYVPHMAEALNVLKDGRLTELSQKTEAASSKWQAGVSQLQLSFFKGDETQDKVPLALPGDLTVYGRVVNCTPPHVEIAVRASPQEFHMTREALAFLEKSSEVHRAWFRALFKLSEDKEERKEKLKQKLEKVNEGVQQLEEGNATMKTLLAAVQDKDYVKTVNTSLNTFSSIAYVRLEGGKALFPMHEKNDTDTTIQFELLECVVENAPGGQIVSLQLKSIGAEKLDHADMPMVLQVQPIRRKQSSVPTDDSGALRLYVNRAAASGEEGEGAAKGNTRAELTLQNVKVHSKGKRALAPAELVQQITAYASKAGDKVASAASLAMQDKVRDDLKKAFDFLDLYWDVTLGECHFTHTDFDAKEKEGGVAPFRGQLKVGALDWSALEQKFEEIEERLIQSKLQQAGSESAKDDMHAEIKALREALERQSKIVEERDVDFGVVNKKLMEERMKLVEKDEQIASLKAQLMAAQRGGGGAAGQQQVPSRSNSKRWFGK